MLTILADVLMTATRQFPRHRQPDERLDWSDRFLAPGQKQEHRRFNPNRDLW